MMKTKRVAGSIASAILTVLIVIMIVAVGYLTYCNITGKVAFIGNYAVIKIVSGSMEPTIPTGDYILVKKAAADEIAVGDVIVFVSRDPQIYGNLNTHRVTGIVEEDLGRKFTTKGDNNNAEDDLKTKAADVTGKYIRNIPLVTKFADIFARKWVFFTFILVPAFLLVINSVLEVIKKSKEIKIDLLVSEEVERLKHENDKKNNNTDNGEV